LTRISEEKINRRKQTILAAAKHVFARKGCAQATMQDVANQAGLSVGAIYTYYPGKDDLMKAVFEDIGESTRGLFNKAGEGADSPAEMLRATGRVLRERFQDPSTKDETVLVLEAILADAREESSAGSGRQLRQAYLLLTEWLFEQAQETGALDPDMDTEALAQLFVSLMVGIHVLNLEFGTGLDVDPVLNMVDEMLLRLGPRASEGRGRNTEEAAEESVVSAGSDE